MGLSKSKNIKVLVLGLTNAGKTHFIDMFQFGPDSTKFPTFGYYETVYSFEGYNFTLTEYGGTMEWDKMITIRNDSFDCIYMIIDATSGIERIMESNSALLMICQHLKNIPVAILWNKSKKSLKLRHVPKNRPMCTSHLDFSESNWGERVSQLFEWTIKNIKKS